jgi:hypothetical protein
MSARNIYYVYAYLREEDGTPFYIGMGKGSRQFDHLKKAKKDLTPKPGQHKLNTIRKLLQEGKEPLIKTIQNNLSRKQAIALEIELISTYGRQDLGTGILTNQTAGGDGNRGWSEEAKQNLRDRNLRLGLKPPSQKGRKQNRNPKYTSIPAKVASTGEIIKASPSDPRWNTGEIIGINKGIVQDANWRKKNSEGVSKLKWWNNGVQCIRSAECPGLDFIQGRGKVKW